jgi:hypothetical protein
VCGMNCVCPVHSTISANGCVCDPGYSLALCNGTPCSGSACDPDFKCAPTSSGSSSGGGSTVCYQSTSVALCSCGSPANIGSCSINSSYGSKAASCAGLDCCQTTEGGNCCDCASTSYLSTLGLSCASWIQQSGGTQTSACP